MRRSRYIAFGVVVLALIAGVVLLRPRPEHEAAASITTTTTTSTSTTTTVPGPAFEAADPVGSSVDLYDTPGAPSPSSALPNPTVEHVPLAFLVKEHGPTGWLKVQVPRRPNESTAWVRSDQVTVRGVENRIQVQRSTHTLTVFKGATNEVLFTAPVGVGTAKTPTPLGSFYVDIIVKLRHPNGVYGPYQVSVAAFSDVFQSFGGGPGQMAIHGTNAPQLIGGDISNGCVRLKNEDIQALIPLVTTGSPVTIVA